MRPVSFTGLPLGETWQPLSQKPETAISFALQILERIVDLPYPTIREAILPLLQELMDLAEQRKEQKGEYRISFDEFCHDFSRYCAPLLGALSYRAHSLGNDAPALMQFIDTFPPLIPRSVPVITKWSTTVMPY